jgi:SOS response regulatory protein OraA/RecX
VPGDAFTAVVGALARRDLTSFELQQRLEQAGYDPAACADALIRAAEAGYLDDARVARERARHLAERDSSDAAIRAELLRRGVSEQDLEAALALVAPEAERAERLASRLGDGLRAARALARRGYPEDVVARALRVHIAEGP